MQHKFGTTHIMHSIFKNGRITPYISLRDCLLHITWDDLKRWTLKTIFNNTIQQSCHTSYCLFARRPQWASWNVPTSCYELLSKIHHRTDMSQILAEGWNHYTVMYGLNSHKLNDKVVGTPKYILKDHGRLLQWHPCWQCQIQKSQGLLASWFSYHRRTNKWDKMYKSTRAMLWSVVGHTSKVDAEKVKLAPIISFVMTRKCTILTCSGKIIKTTVSSLQALYHFRYPNKSNQVMTSSTVKTIKCFLNK